MILDCQTFPSADCGSDHVLLAAKCRLRLKKLPNRRQYEQRIRISPLNVKRIARKFGAELDESTKDIETDLEPEEAWKKWKAAAKSVAEKVIPKENRPTKNKAWITDEILELITERRRIQDRNSVEYRILHKEVIKKCREAKQEWFQGKCRQIQKLDEDNRVQEMHSEIRKMMKEQKRAGSRIMIIEKATGDICSNKKELEEVWTDYVRQLYSDDQRHETNGEEERLETAPEITMDELAYAIRKAKRRKAVGADNIPIELLKCSETKSRKAILQILNKIYRASTIPEDFSISTFIPIPKKVAAKKCSEYRTISIMSHTLKLLLSIVNKRIENKIDEHLSKTQFGFRAHRSTRDAIALFKVIIQRALSVNRIIYACFVDYEKAFDKVEHIRMLEILRKYRIDKEDLKIIETLYFQQKANIKVANEVTNEYCKIEKGVRQGCPLSPRLFNIYAEEIFQHRFFRKCGLKINGERIADISYADDKVLLAETPQQLQTMMRRLNIESNKFGMKINVDKTKVMRIGRVESEKPLDIEIDGRRLEQVSRYKYLGAIITCDGRDSEEIRTRLGTARNAFNNLERVLRDKGMSIQLRHEILQCYIWSIARYASETWTFTKTVVKKIKAFEFWCYRKMNRIKWTEKVSNGNVLSRMNLQEAVLVSTLENKKHKYIRNRIKEDELFARALQGKIVGKVPRGRRRMSMLNDSLINESNVFK